MYGEHLTDAEIEAVIEGSSPHVRGALAADLIVCEAYGIIPACTGSTKQRRGGCAVSRDHPRMYGEHCIFLSNFRRVKGSSPHVRGAPDGKPRGVLHRGDHPRMYGEHGST